MGKKWEFLISKGLQKSTVLLRNGGLLESWQFPELLGPVECKRVLVPNKWTNTINEYEVYTVRYYVKIGVRKNFNPRVLWLRFNKTGSSVYFSPQSDLGSEFVTDWLCINRFKNVRVPVEIRSVTIQQIEYQIKING